MRYVTESCLVRGTDSNLMVNQQNCQQHVSPQMPVVVLHQCGFLTETVSNLDSRWRSRLVPPGPSEVVVSVAPGRCLYMFVIVVISKCIGYGELAFVPLHIVQMVKDCVTCKSCEIQGVQNIPQNIEHNYLLCWNCWM